MIANNLANASTAGFKRALLQVEAQPSNDIYRYQTDPGQLGANRTPGVPAIVPVGQLGSGSQIYATPTNFEQGDISLNGNTLSFALSGPGFFAIRDAATGTIRYSRAGTFERGEDGNLRTTNGDLVLDDGGNAVPVPALGKIEVDGQGNLSVDGAVTARFGVLEFDNVQNLQPVGATEYTNVNNVAGVHPATNTTVIQYAEERSNGDVIRSMVDLITNQRWFEANEKSISTQDDATNQAITVVGRTS